MEKGFNCLYPNEGKRRALLKKEGQSNIKYRRVPQRNIRYVKDVYITLLDLSWTWVLVILFLVMLATYFLFAIIYFLLSYANGDLIDHAHNATYHQPCISNLHNFWDALLFSIETQSTIGYGTIYPNASCVGNIPVIYTQITVGFLLETLLLGFIFVKIARPKHRRHTLMFSRNACLCLEDRQLTLQVRVGDIRNSHLIDCHVYGALVKRYVCQEKYVYPLFQYEVNFEAHGMKNNIFLMWPMVLRHRIDPQSPLYSLTSEDLKVEHFELMMFLQGTIESTGEMVQARTSYTNQEIFWGCRFVQLEEYDHKCDTWYMNFNLFDEMEACPVPTCNGQPLEMNKHGEDRGHGRLLDSGAYKVRYSSWADHCSELQ